jgi:hypothetical protein
MPLHCLLKELICELKSVHNCLFRVLGETLVIRNVKVQIVSQEISAHMPRVPIKECIVLAAGPGTLDFFTFRLVQLQNNADPILIVLSLNALVCSGAVRQDPMDFAS